MSHSTKGKAGERLIARFFDAKFSRLFSFPNPKTKSNAEVADVLIWWNHVVLLVEVKTKDKARGTTDQWACSKIREAAEQILKGKARIDNKETINLCNDSYHLPLAYEGLDHIVGLIVLISDDPVSAKPTEALPDIYHRGLPVHVLSWRDLCQMTEEIDTVPDLLHYLRDRFRYLRNTDDIPLDCEMNVLGSYKMRENAFPETSVDFPAYDYWREYRRTRASRISAREEHNECSAVFDTIAAQIPSVRRLYEGLPQGIYFAWEMAARTRRERAYCGEKLMTVPLAFKRGKSSRQFSIQTQETSNWLVFYFSRKSKQESSQRLLRLVELKLVKEVHFSQFECGVFGLALRVAEGTGFQFEGIACATFTSADAVRGKYLQQDLKEAIEVWGMPSDNKKFRIHEFPD